MSNEEVKEILVAMESAALRRWGDGDPSGFIEICAADVVYFDPYLEKRIDGLEALIQYYRGFWGQVRFDRFELLDPCAQVGGELAVLTFNYASYVGDKKTSWNCTEVYCWREDGWRIIQTHWSYTRHPAIVGN
ncbi:MAG: nuclear transport factor 2 family protein [Chloroflexi bacterium]|nr:nuclear transport factor 2 family protein [Chloroflexota bacterium]